MGQNCNVLTYESPSSTVSSSPPNRSFILQVINKRRTSILLTLLVCATLLSSWHLINSVLSWYASAVTTSSSSSPIWWPAIYASVAVGLIFGLLSMAAALAVAVPTIVVIWISVLVLMTFCGKSKEWVVVEGKKLSVEMSRKVGMAVIKEGNLVAALCAVFGYFLLVRYGVRQGL